MSCRVVSCAREQRPVPERERARRRSQVLKGVGQAARSSAAPRERTRRPRAHYIRAVHTGRRAPGRSETAPALGTFARSARRISVFVRWLCLRADAKVLISNPGGIVGASIYAALAAVVGGSARAGRADRAMPSVVLGVAMVRRFFFEFSLRVKKEVNLLWCGSTTWSLIDPMVRLCKAGGRAQAKGKTVVEPRPFASQLPR